MILYWQNNTVSTNLNTIEEDTDPSIENSDNVAIKKTDQVVTLYFMLMYIIA